MKKKVLTLLGALAALGLAACDPAAPASSAPASNPASSQPAASSKPAESSKPASSTPASSTPASSSQPAVETDPFKKATGHSVKNYQDVPGDTEKGTAAYKMGLCDDNDGFSAIRVNQSAVTYPSGSKRKDGTPEGYTKLDGDGQKMTFKIEVAKGYTGKLYLFGVMDNWSKNTGSSFFYNGAPNTKIEVNGVSIDCSAQNGKTYLDYFGDGQGEGTLSPEGYAEFGSCTLKPGVNEIVYTRVATLNMLVKDFVFVGEEAQEWTTTEVAATEGKVGYKKSVNNFDGSVKIEIKALDGAMASGSSNKNGTPEGFLKLDGNGNKIGYTFDFGENLDGKFYQRGMMDNYSGTNVNCTYYSKSNTGSGDKRGNFKATVNGNAIYLGDKKDITYSTMLGAETQEIGGKTYSKVADCEIGDAFIKNGENYIEFERIDSFNLSISEFVFIGRSASAHAALDETAVWKMDENTHWKEMPNDTFKWNRADNVWEADPDHADVPATCVSTGKTYEREKESHLTREKDTPINPNNHASLSTTNSDGKAIHLGGECPDCHEHVEEGIKISVLDFSGSAGDCIDGSVSDGAFKPKKVDITYKIPVAQAGNYALSLGMLYTNGNGKKAMSDRNFSVKINGVAATLTMDGTATPESLGMGMTGDPTDVVLIAPLALEVGEVSISIKNPDYRMMWKGFVTLTPYTAPTPTLGE